MGWCCLDDANHHSPALIWCDQRSRHKSMTSITGRQGNRPLQHRQSGAHGFHFAQLLWVRNNEPELRAFGSFSAERLHPVPIAGVHVCDVSDASGTALFDVAPPMVFSFADQLGSIEVFCPM
jgi:sugar (pentulose or hexulose) kinase